MNAKKLIAILSVMALAAGVFAQGGGRGGQRFGMFGRGGGAMVLIQRDDVKDELKLTADQTTKLADLRDTQRTRMQEAFQSSGIQFGGGPPDEATQKKMQEVMAKVQEQNQKDLDGILTPEQSKRLRELVVQRSGNAVANDPSFQKDLGITDDQKAKLADLQAKQREAMMSLFQNQDMSREDRQAAMEKNAKIMTDEIGKILTDDQKAKIKDINDEYRKDVQDLTQGNSRPDQSKMAGLRKEAFEKTTKVLTDDQQKAWKDLTGEPFEVSFEGPFGGGRRRNN